MSISKEEFDMLQSGDRILIKEEIEGIKKGQKSSYFWVQFLGEWITVRQIIRNEYEYPSVSCFESIDKERGFDVSWLLEDIEEVDNSLKQVFDRE